MCRADDFILEIREKMTETFVQKLGEERSRYFLVEGRGVLQVILNQGITCTRTLY